MTWKLKVVDVSGTVAETVGDPPEVVTTDLTATGRWRVKVQYYDDADPNTILHEHDFIWHADRTNATQALAEAQEFGDMIRTARTQVANMQGNVGKSFAVP